MATTINCWSAGGIARSRRHSTQMRGTRPNPPSLKARGVTQVAIGSGSTSAAARDPQSAPVVLQKVSLTACGARAEVVRSSDTTRSAESVHDRAASAASSTKATRSLR
jgi:hypothetical protein